MDDILVIGDIVPVAEVEPIAAVAKALTTGGLADFMGEGGFSIVRVGGDVGAAIFAQEAPPALTFADNFDDVDADLVEVGAAAACAGLEPLLKVLRISTSGVVLAIPRLPLVELLVLLLLRLGPVGAQAFGLLDPFQRLSGLLRKPDLDFSLALAGLSRCWGSVPSLPAPAPPPLLVVAPNGGGMDDSTGLLPNALLSLSMDFPPISVLAAAAPANVNVLELESMAALERVSALGDSKTATAS